MSQIHYFVIDFDSTFTKIEAFDLLANICLANHLHRKEIHHQVKQITQQTMDGKLSMRKSLEKRIALLPLHRKHLEPLVKKLSKNISPSIVRNHSFFETHSEQIYIISNGFHDFINPIVVPFGIPNKNIYANTFRFDQEDNIIGFDENNPLSSDNGKVEQLKRINLSGNIYVIGDGYTDYEMKHAGLANKFFVFTENVKRTNIIKKADHVTPNFDDFLYLNRIKASVSYPKNRIQILLLENVNNIARQQMKSEGFSVASHTKALDEKKLEQAIHHISVLGIRSKTKITSNTLKHAQQMMAIGAFCIGINQIDIEAATDQGIAVFNAPFSNTRSVVELVIAELILLMRSIPDKMKQMAIGKWSKSTKGSFEIRGKILGIIGYGNIGSQLSVLAESMGMKIMYYDVEEKLALGNALKCDTLETLLTLSDAISIHVDGRSDNHHMIGKEEFGIMKKGVIFINLSRGTIVDISALKDAIHNKIVAGCGVDVFPQEPLHNNDDFSSELIGLPNTLLTPHIGGSTQEAQENIAKFVSAKLTTYINTGSTTQSINFPNITLPPLENAHRLIHIHKNIPGVLADINAVLARNKVNILGQYLKTNDRIGYVITDIDKKYSNKLIQSVRHVKHSIKFRVLY